MGKGKGGKRRGRGKEREREREKPSELPNILQRGPTPFGLFSY